MAIQLCLICNNEWTIWQLKTEVLRVCSDYSVEQDCRQSAHSSLPVYWSILSSALKNTGVSNVAALWPITSILSGLPLGLVPSIFSSQMIAGNLLWNRPIYVVWNLLTLLACGGSVFKTQDIYWLFNLYVLTIQIEQKQPTVVRILPAVAYSQPLFF